MSQTRFNPSSGQSWNGPVEVYATRSAGLSQDHTADCGLWRTSPSNIDVDTLQSSRFSNPYERSHTPGFYSTPRLGIVHPLNESEKEKNLMEPLLIDTGLVNPNDSFRKKNPSEQSVSSFHQGTKYKSLMNQSNYSGSGSGLPLYLPNSVHDIGKSGYGYTCSSYRPIDPIKEDPDMDDDAILTSKKLSDLRKHLASQRLRLSISANDLIGKSHEELILLLIQLRRSQAKMENLGKVLNARLDLMKATVSSTRQVSQQKNGDYFEDGEYCKELQQQRDEVNKQLDVIKPLVHLLHNMVTMGSIYGGDNLMLASQYKQHKLGPGEYTAPRKMIEFARHHQEEQLFQELQHEMNTLSKEEIDLEKKLAKLYDLDHLLQETSMSVSSLQEDKMLLEKALESCTSQEGIELDLHERKKLENQRKAIEAELSSVRQQLVETSRTLEETATENAKVEHEFILLRTQIYGRNQSRNTVNENEDSHKVRTKIEKELNSIQSVMDGLSKQRDKLSEVMDSLKPLPLSVHEDVTERGYVETDLDTFYSRDIGLAQTHRPASKKFKDILHRSSSLSLDISKINHEMDEGYSLNSYESVYADNQSRQQNYYGPSPQINRTNMFPQMQKEGHVQGQLSENQHLDPVSKLEEPTGGDFSEQTTNSIQKPTFAVSPLRQSGVPIRNTSVHAVQISSDVFSSQNDSSTRTNQLNTTSFLTALDPGTETTVMSNSLTRWKGLNSVLEEDTPQPNRTTGLDRDVYQPERQQQLVPPTNQKDTQTHALYQGQFFSNILENRPAQTYQADQIHTTIYQTEQRQAPIYKTDQRQAPTYQTDQRQTPAYLTDQRQTPAYSADQGQTPAYSADQRQTPAYQTDQGQTPVYLTDQRQTPVYLTDQGQTPAYSADQRQTPAYSADQRQTPAYQTDQGQTPVYLTDQRQTPVYLTDQGQTPAYSADQRQTPAYQTDQRLAPIYPADQRQTPAYPTDQGHAPMYTMQQRDHLHLMDHRQDPSFGKRQTQMNQGQAQYQVLNQPLLLHDFRDSSLPNEKKQELVHQITQNGKNLQHNHPKELNSTDAAQAQETDGYGSMQQNGFKEKTKLKTVRDVKKNEIERRSRDRFPQHKVLDNHPLRRSTSLPGFSGRSVSLTSLKDQRTANIFSTFDRKSTSRLSAASRLFPQGQQPSKNVKSPENLRRMSDLYTAHAFTSPANVLSGEYKPTAGKTGYVHRRGPDVEEVSSATDSLLSQKHKTKTYDNKWYPIAVPIVGPRGRALTISSSHPVSMELTTPKAVRSHSVAGDLISMRPNHQTDIVRSMTTEDLDYDDTTIEREVLFVPEKVFIPERYIPDSDEEVSESEKIKRQEKAIKIRKMLAAHSLHEFGQKELEDRNGFMHHVIEEERQRCEHLLDLKRTLAKQATSRSKQVAEKFYEDQAMSLSGAFDSLHGSTSPPQTPRAELLCLPVTLGDTEIVSFGCGWSSSHHNSTLSHSDAVL